MKHTKGPWTFVDGKYKSRDQYERFTVECESNIPGMPGIIAKVGFKPNAHLIAAAPDLLEACESAAALLNGLGRENGSVYKDLKSAIAKAKGEE